MLVCGAGVVARPALAEDKVIRVPTSDATMNAAIEKARASLDDFLKIADAPPADVESASIKVKIVDQKQSEHFWVTPFKHEGDRFAGVIANEPQLVKNVTFGQVYQFTRADISDWMIRRGGRIHGAYTLRALLPLMSADEAAQYRAMLADE
jgi:uncharacterized protein YegJ (DUF2314 family)